MLRRHGFTISTSVLAWLSSVFLLVDGITGLIFAVGNHNDADYLVIESVCLTIGCAALFGAALNISLMWIEFVLATKRLATLSNNLKTTRSILIGYLSCYTITSAGLMIAVHATDDVVYTSLFMATCIASATLLMTTFTIGARRLSHEYVRAETSFVAEAMEIASSFANMPDASRASRGAKERQKADDIRGRAELIVHTSYRVNAGLAVFVGFATPWCMFVVDIPVGVSDALLWSFNSLLQLGIAMVICAIAQFLVTANPRLRRLSRVDPVDILSESIMTAPALSMRYSSARANSFNHGSRDQDAGCRHVSEAEAGGSETPRFSVATPDATPDASFASKREGPEHTDGEGLANTNGESPHR